LCGASMVQIGTALHQQGVDIFEGKRIKWLILPLHESETD